MQEEKEDQVDDAPVADLEGGDDEVEVTTVVVIDTDAAAEDDADRLATPGHHLVSPGHHLVTPGNRLRPFFQVVNGKMIAAATSEDNAAKGGHSSKHTVGLNFEL